MIYFYVSRRNAKKLICKQCFKINVCFLVRYVKDIHMKFLSKTEQQLSFDWEDDMMLIFSGLV